MEFGNYVIGKPLGRGGMGVVYEARPKHLQGEGVWRFCIKTLKPDEFTSSEKAAIIREQRKLIEIRSDYVVKLIDADCKNDLPYIVMERVEGVSLATRLLNWNARPAKKSERIKAQQQCADWALMVCLGLEAIHEKGFVHGDINPSNILLDNHNGKTKLIDMGISVNSGAAQVFGWTSGYCSPEQVGQIPDVTIDGRSDIYSVGMVLFKMLTGSTELGHSDSHGDWDPFAHHKDIHLDIAAITRKCLQKYPADRYQTVTELKQDLVRFLQGLSVSARKPRFFREQLPRWVGFHKTLSVSIAICLFVLLPLAGVVILQDRSAEQTRADQYLHFLNVAISQLRDGNLAGAAAAREEMTKYAGARVPNQVVGEVNRLDRELAVARTLEQVRDAVATGSRVRIPGNGIADFMYEVEFPDLTETLRGVGVADILKDPPHISSASVNDCWIRSQISSTLYLWASVARDEELQRLLLRVASGVEPAWDYLLQPAIDGNEKIVITRFKEILARGQSSLPPPESIVAVSQLLTRKRIDPERILTFALSDPAYRKRCLQTFWFCMEYAKAQARNSEFSQAIESLGWAETVRGGTAIVRFRLAFANEMLGLGKTAEHLYREAVEIDPGLSWAYRGIVRIHHTSVVLNGKPNKLINCSHQESVRRLYKAKDWCAEHAATSLKIAPNDAIEEIKKMYNDDHSLRDAQLALADRLEEFLRGDYNPMSKPVNGGGKPEEQFKFLLELAAFTEGRYYDAVRLVESNFAAEAREYLRSTPWTLAAIYTNAASVALHQDPEAAKRFRDKAHDYLIETYKAIASQERQNARANLRRMLRDFDFRGLRDENHLASIPLEERRKFHTFWDQVWADFSTRGGGYLDTWIR
ncbi:MAG: protein kinase domain-containing protein [Fimbriiglobus sp.]